jgi:hypothetical protein
MAEYDLGFASKLAEIAADVDERQGHNYDARRAIAYLSRVSFEITMKALLEKAGVPVPKIRARSHDLRGLLADLSECEVEIEIAPGSKAWSSAARLRGESIDLGFFQIPIGELITAEDQGASQYPNQIRYGERVIDVDPSFLSGAARLAAKWAVRHWATIRRRRAE